MTTLRIPDVLGAMDAFELRTHPDEAEVSRATNEWFARCVLHTPAIEMSLTFFLATT